MHVLPGVSARQAIVVALLFAASNSQPQNEEPKELPRTAGSVDLFGLIGLLSMGGYLTTLPRR
jgi:hypothetical protein